MLLHRRGSSGRSGGRGLALALGRVDQVVERILRVHLDGELLDLGLLGHAYTPAKQHVVSLFGDSAHHSTAIQLPRFRCASMSTVINDKPLQQPGSPSGRGHEPNARGPPLCQRMLLCLLVYGWPPPCRSLALGCLDTSAFLASLTPRPSNT
ncbi:hypothetical protein BC940DRAFT_299806 [Gongronella butleri]|nr:hypothetical protein BC940DRAFT_299806 [Gongronella butleri]